MKGIVFTEFLDMVESAYSADLVDDIIEDADLDSGGVYTAVATYPHQEMVALVTALCQRTGLGMPDALKGFGHYLFGRFHALYPQFFQDVSDSFAFLSGIEGIIHAQVLKLYPDAELPRFHIERHDARNLIIRYESVRHFEDLAEGLINACAEHFGESITLARETVGEGESRQERFTLTRT